MIPARGKPAGGRGVAFTGMSGRNSSLPADTEFLRDSSGGVRGKIAAVRSRTPSAHHRRPRQPAPSVITLHGNSRASSGCKDMFSAGAQGRLRSGSSLPRLPTEKCSPVSRGFLVDFPMKAQATGPSEAKLFHRAQPHRRARRLRSNAGPLERRPRTGGPSRGSHCVRYGSVLEQLRRFYGRLSIFGRPIAGCSATRAPSSTALLPSRRSTSCQYFPPVSGDIDRDFF